MKLAVLCGGLATRLRPMTNDLPKSLIPIMDRPFIFHQLELIHRNGLTDVVLCVGHLGEMIRDAVGSGNQFGLSVEYSSDGQTRLGTGGALLHALPKLGSEFLFMYGDSYLDVSFQHVISLFRMLPALALSTRCIINGVFVDYGLTAMSARAFEHFSPEDSAFDVPEIFQFLMERTELATMLIPFPFHEIGSPEGLVETRAYLQYLATRGGQP